MFYYLLLEPTTNIDEIFEKINKSHQLSWIKNICIKEEILMPRSIYFESIKYDDITVKNIIFCFLQNIKYNGQFELYKPLTTEFCVI